VAKRDPIAAKLKKVQELWNNSKDQPPGVAPGTYVVQLVNAEIRESASSGNLYVAREFVVTEGEYQGQQANDILSFASERSIHRLATWLELSGYEAPDNIEDIPDILAKMTADGPIYRAGVRRSGDFTNVNCTRLLGYASEEPEGEDEVEAVEAEEEEDVFEEETEDEDEDEDEEEEEDLDFEEDEDEEDEEEDEEEDIDFEEEEDDPQLAALLDFCEANDVEVPDGSDKDDIVEILSDFVWDAKDLTKAELKLLQEAGVPEDSFENLPKQKKSGKKSGKKSRK